MSELKVGKRYTYKNHVYEIVNLGLMKLDKDWVDAVAYKRVLEDDEKEELADITTVYTRSRVMFEELFIPRNLEVGDTVMAVSMGKRLGYYRVEQILGGDNVKYQYVSVETQEKPSECKLVTYDAIGFNGRVYVSKPDNRFSHLKDCVEYYFLSDRVRKIIACKEKIELIKSKLMSIHEAVNKIDVANFRNEGVLDQYSIELTKLIEQIQKDGYVQWPQSKKL